MTSGVILISVRSRRRCLMISCPAACGIRCVKPSIATVSPSRTHLAIASASDTISAIPLQPPHGVTATTATGFTETISIRPLGEQLCGLRRLLQDFGGDCERAVGGGNAGVDRDLQQDLADLLRRQPVAQRRAGMHREFFFLAQRGQSRERDHASLGSGETRPGPDFAPCVASDELLEGGGEVGHVGYSSVNVSVAKDLASCAHAWFVGRRHEKPGYGGASTADDRRLALITDTKPRYSMRTLQLATTHRDHEQSRRHDRNCRR